MQKQCPSSPLIFSVVLETLASSIRQSQLIKGIAALDTECKLILYAKAYWVNFFPKVYSSMLN